MAHGGGSNSEYGYTMASTWESLGSQALYHNDYPMVSLFQIMGWDNLSLILPLYAAR